MNKLWHYNKSGNVISGVDFVPCHIGSLSISSARVCRKLFSKSVFSSARVNCWNSAVKLPSICSLFSRNILTHTATRNRLHTSRSHFSLSVSLKQPTTLHLLKTLFYSWPTMVLSYLVTLSHLQTSFVFGAQLKIKLAVKK